MTSMASATQKPGWPAAVRGLPAPVTCWQPVTRAVTVRKCRDPAVKYMLSLAITAAKARGKYVGICGQGPSDHPDFADWLAQEGIASISLNPDTVVETWQRLAKR